MIREESIQFRFSYSMMWYVRQALEAAHDDGARVISYDPSSGFLADRANAHRIFDALERMTETITSKLLEEAITRMDDELGCFH